MQCTLIPRNRYRPKYRVRGVTQAVIHRRGDTISAMLMGCRSVRKPLVRNMSAPIDTTRESDAQSTGVAGSLWADPHDDGDLGDMLQELRVLLPGSQTLTAFLVILPFNS